MIHDPALRAALAPLARTVETVIPEADLLRKLARKTPLRCKLGLDLTATQVHVGNGIQLWNLRRLQDLGHRAVIILGDETALVGDPSGKDKTRPMLSQEQVEENGRTWLAQLGKILDLDKTEVRRNSEWFSSMPFLEVLRLADRMTVQQMLERDSFEKRFAEGSPISIREFLYCLMQGWDSVQVKADVELGGTDQTFNLTVGRRLMEQMGMEPQACLIGPLVEGVDGQAKMSKSLHNSIGLADPPKEQFGLAMRISDDLIPRYLRLLTDLPDAEIDELLTPGVPRMQAKLRLAEALVARYHGAEEGRHQRAEWDRVIRGKGVPEDLPDVPVRGSRHGIVDLVVACGFARSKSAARRLVEQGGVAIDETTVKDVHATVDVRTGAVLRVGSRRFARLVVQAA
jgi:tyrosyl-tRNA synthetase